MPRMKASGVKPNKSSVLYMKIVRFACYSRCGGNSARDEPGVLCHCCTYPLLADFMAL